jgi:hypothetical protein
MQPLGAMDASQGTKNSTIRYPASRASDLTKEAQMTFHIYRVSICVDVR